MPLENKISRQGRPRNSSKPPQKKINIKYRDAETQFDEDLSKLSASLSTLEGESVASNRFLFNDK